MIDKRLLRNRTIRLGKNGSKVSALDRRAKLRRKAAGKPKVTYQRFEKDGKVMYVRGEEKRMVPSEAACRERLVKLLEAAGGEVSHQSVKDFWIEQGAKFFSPDDLICAWQEETYPRLSKVWEELISPPAVPDLLAEFEL